MTVSFPLTNGRSLDQLMRHLSNFNLSCPGNCALAVNSHFAVVISQHAFALSTAKTAW